MTSDSYDTFSSKVGHVIRLDKRFMTYAAGAQALCIERDLAYDFGRLCVPIHVLAFDDGSVQTMTDVDLMEADAHVVAYLPQFRASTQNSAACSEFRTQAQRIPDLLTRLIEDRRNALRVHVERGATHLDATYPAWWDRIDLATLDVACLGYCVVAQLYGGYAYGLMHRVLPPPMAQALTQAIQAAERYGFLMPSDGCDTEYTTLTELWRTEIVVRRMQASARESGGVA